MFLNAKQDDTFFESLSERKRFWYGTFMWAVLFLAYMVFCFNWLVMSKLEGKSTEGTGWANTFKIADNSSTLEAVNYSLLFARGIAMVWVAWIMVKLSHKRAVVISLFLNMACIFLPFIAELGPKYFWLFVFARFLTGLGGTMSIIFIQPVLSKFFNLNQKAIFSFLNSFAYVFGALIANFMFLNPTVKNILINNWQLVVFWASVTSFIPFFLYACYGKNFNTLSVAQKESEQHELYQNTYRGVIKEKSSWFWIFWYSFLLVASVSISNTVPNKIVGQINSDLLKATEKYVDWKSLYTIIFYSGCFLGFFLGRWNKTQFQRKPFVVLCCWIGVFFWFVIFFTLFLSKKIGSVASTAIIFTSVFLFAFFSMGIQTVILFIPHEYEENKSTRRVAIFFSYLWGLGYIVYAIYYVTLSLILGAVGGTKGALMVMLAFTLLISLFGVFACFIKEPRPTWKIHPWDKKNRGEILNQAI